MPTSTSLRRLLLVVLLTSSSACDSSQSFVSAPVDAGLPGISAASALSISENALTMVAASNGVGTLDNKSTSVGDSITARQLLEVYRTCMADPSRPVTLASLTDGYKLYQSTYTESAAVSLGILAANEISGKGKALLYKYNFWRIARSNCTISGVAIPVVWGVGISSVLHLRSAKRNAKVSTLPGLAASVEFDRADVTLRLEVDGLVGQAIEQAFPSARDFAEFDVQAYGAWASSLDRIRLLVSDTTVTATPQLVITDEALPAIRQALQKR